MHRRALLASVEVFAERGYEGTGVADLLDRAALDRSTFEACFGDKENCFLAAYDLLLAEAIDRIAVCASPHGSWGEQLAAGLAAILAIVDERPAAARLVLLETKTASPKAQARYTELVRSGARFLRGGQVHCQQPIAPAVETAQAGGLAFMLAQHLRERRSAPVAQLYPEALRFLLLPYLSEPKTSELVAAAA